MTKIYALLFALVVLLGSLAIAAPLEGAEVIAEDENWMETLAGETMPEILEDATIRSKRATCQIPIIGDWVSDSACAAGCIARGRAGGHCRNEICHCREDMMLDLLRKRFNF
ncbi:hypothetical protein KPH14_009563 [Odynerus spinipes]|uniref:Invertebrate defensins family profile domain-containing protein n=1 Tax=Odynerus spinipes TaxID=1348599 RepID=A0AAD9VRM8_9HYME|nr:hypothetical protein KPH14_009563 [Odynerus spinipes]